MIKRILITLICVWSIVCKGQDYSQSWEGFFSYYNIKDITQSSSKIYAASENAVFSYDGQTHQMEELTTINGLSGETISTIHYSTEFGLLMIGYENGLIEIAFDNNDDILSIVDIVEKNTIQPDRKFINHFNEHNGKVYISSGFGISVYDLEGLEFGDTYYIGDFGSQVAVEQTEIFGDFIYAACRDNNGFKRALFNGVDLINYQNWSTISSGNFLAVQGVQNELYVVRNDNSLFEVNGANLLLKNQYSQEPRDVRNVMDYLIVTTAQKVFIYESDFTLVSSIPMLSDFNTKYTSALIFEDNIYIGSEDFGVLSTNLFSSEALEEIHPEGPLLNSAFSITALPNQLWVTFGDYTEYFDPYPLTRQGVSHLINEEWVNIPYDSLLGATDLNWVSVNPFNYNKVYISSFFSGLLELDSNSAEILYNQTNSSLESLSVPGNPDYVDVRVGASAFDSSGKLWMMNSRVLAPLKSYDPSSGQWQSFDFSDIFPDSDSELGFNDLAVDNNGTKWIGGNNFGIIGYNENISGTNLKYLRSEESNMPSWAVKAVALDENNQVWIGTAKGLRVLYNTSNFFSSSNVQVNEIVILDEGEPAELLYQQYITDIEVDGANNKWISTNDSGVFYLSSDGQETIFHFTKDNSPLPYNSVRDVSIDASTGKVYFATDKGLVAFFSGSSEPKSGLEDAFVYPNPVRPTFNLNLDKVKIKDLSENVNIKITDIEGNIVAEAQSGTNLRYKGYNLEIDGGTAYWNGRNLANNEVRSGVYLIMISDLDTFESKVLKLMVIR